MKNLELYRHLTIQFSKSSGSSSTSLANLETPVNRRQWTYPGVKHRFFHLRNKKQIRSLSCHIKFYRDVLYTFAMFRKFVTFDIKRKVIRHQRYNEEVAIHDADYDEEISFEVDFEIENEKIEYRIYKGCFLNYHTNICIDKYYEIIKDLINQSWEQFLGDLMSVSQHHGYSLLTSAYPPAIVQYYYNILEISRMIVTLHLNNLYVNEIDNFLEKRRKGLSKLLLLIIGKTILQKPMTDPDVRKFSNQWYSRSWSERDKEWFRREINYLFGKFGSVSGPYPHDHYCPLGASEYVHLRVKPSFIQLNFPSKDKSTYYLKILQEWKNANLDYVVQNSGPYRSHKLDGRELLGSKNINNFSNRPSPIICKIPIESPSFSRDHPPGFIPISSIPPHNISKTILPVCQYYPSDHLIKSSPTPGNLPDFSMQQPSSSAAPLPRLSESIPDISDFADFEPQFYENYEETSQAVEDSCQHPPVSPREAKHHLEDSHDDIQILEEFIKKRKVDVTTTFLYAVIIKKLDKFMKRNFYVQSICIREDLRQPDKLENKEQRCLLKFLHETGNLPEIHNVTLWDILCYRKFLERDDPKCYENFVRELRSRLSNQIEVIFQDSEVPKTIYEAIYEKLKIILFQ